MEKTDYKTKNISPSDFQELFKNLLSQNLKKN